MAKLGIVSPFLLCISFYVSNLLSKNLHSSFQSGSLFSFFGDLYLVTQTTADQHMVSSLSFSSVSAVGAGGDI